MVPSSRTMSARPCGSDSSTSPKTTAQNKRCIQTLLPRVGVNWGKFDSVVATYPPPLRGDAIAMAISLKVNGTVHTVSAEPDTPLLYVLRNDLGLIAAKFGCGLGQCGSCTVLVDGAPVRSCIMPIDTLGQSEVTTLEGIGTLE